MPTGVSPVVELLVETARQHLNRVQAGNEGLHQENIQLIEEIHDLRQHIQMRREMLERRRRLQLGFRGGVYRVVVAPPAADA